MEAGRFLEPMCPSVLKALNGTRENHPLPHPFSEGRVL